MQAHMGMRRGSHGSRGEKKACRVPEENAAELLQSVQSQHSKIEFKKEDSADERYADQPLFLFRTQDAHRSCLDELVGC